MKPIRIAHIVNPVKVTKDRDLYFQQPIVFKSMEMACSLAKDYGILVDLFTTSYSEDLEFRPEGIYWQALRNLNFTSLPLGFTPERKLPYFYEILNRAYEASDDCDLIIQTNADIILQPHFYLLVAHLYNDSFDAFCINKRITPESKDLMNVDALPILYSTQGTPHAGHDCFVFDRSLYPGFDLGDIIMGTPWSEGTMIANMAYYAKKFYVFKHALATFHIGDRRIWLGKEHNQARFHNTNETANIILSLSKKSNGKKFTNHDTIQYLIGKLKQEVKSYGEENYNEACIEIINTL